MIQSREVSGYPQSLPGEAKGFDAYLGMILNMPRECTFGWQRFSGTSSFDGSPIIY